MESPWLPSQKESLMPHRLLDDVGPGFYGYSPPVYVPGAISHSQAIVTILDMVIFE